MSVGGFVVISCWDGDWNVHTLLSTKWMRSLHFLTSRILFLLFLFGGDNWLVDLNWGRYMFVLGMSLHWCMHFIDWGFSYYWILHVIIIDMSCDMVIHNRCYNWGREMSMIICNRCMDLIINDWYWGMSMIFHCLGGNLMINYGCWYLSWNMSLLNLGCDFCLFDDMIILCRCLNMFCYNWDLLVEMGLIINFMYFNLCWLGDLTVIFNFGHWNLSGSMSMIIYLGWDFCLFDDMIILRGVCSLHNRRMLLLFR